MSSRLTRITVCLGLITGVTVSTDAQSDVTKDVKKQRAQTEALLSAAGVKKTTSVETDGIVMYGTVPPAQAKTLAETLQKVYQTSRASLKFGGDESIWPGKMTVVVLNDPKEFAEYYRKLNKGQPPAEGQSFAYSLQGDTPYLVIGPTTGADPREFDPTRAAAALMATAVLNRRAGTGMGNGTVPNWLAAGFAEGVLVRTDDNPQAVSSYRNAMRTNVLGVPGSTTPFRTATLSDAFKTGNPVMSAAFVEYLQARTTPAQFNRFLAAFQEKDGRPPPSLDAALKTLPFSRVSMETDWKVWAAQQR